MKNYRQLGFNIIELLIIIAIMGIVTGIALPSYQNMVKNNCLTTSTNTLVTSLQLARSEAIKRRENITLTAKGGGWGVGWLITDATANVLRDITLTCTATTITETGSDTAFIYRSTGFIDARGTFNVCDDRTGENGRQITINTVGRPNTNNTFTCG